MICLYKVVWGFLEFWKSWNLAYAKTTLTFSLNRILPGYSLFTSLRLFTKNLAGVNSVSALSRCKYPPKLLQVSWPRNIFLQDPRAISLKCNHQEREHCYFPIFVGGWEPNLSKSQLANTDGYSRFSTFPLMSSSTLTLALPSA